MQQAAEGPRRVRVERGIYRNPSTGGYEIQYTDRDGRVRWRRVYGGLRDARLERAEVQTRLGRGDPMVRSRRTFADVGEEWLAAQTHLRKRTHSLYTTALRRHLAPRLGALRIVDVDEDAIARLIAELQASGLSGWTVQGILVPLGRILNHAARRGLIADNPMRRLERRERPRVERREMRILNSEEIDAVLQVATPAYRNVLATAIFTGLRQSELLGLTWADVDLGAGIIRVRRQLDRGGGYSEPKTPRSKRDVVLMPSLVTLLREHQLASAYSSSTDPVFVTRTGRPLYYRNLIRGAPSRAREGRSRQRRAATAPLPRPPPHICVAIDRAGPQHRFHRQSARARVAELHASCLRRFVRSRGARQPRPRPARSGLRRDADGALAAAFRSLSASVGEALVQAVCGGCAPVATA